MIGDMVTLRGAIANHFLQSWRLSLLLLMGSRMRLLNHLVMVDYLLTVSNPFV